MSTPDRYTESLRGITDSALKRQAELDAAEAAAKAKADALAICRMKEASNGCREWSGSTTEGSVDGECISLGIELNTNVPGIGRCILTADTTNAFPKLMGTLMSIVTSLMLVIGFIMVVAAGVMITM